MTSISPKKILIVKNRAMGDSVMGISTVSYIKSLFPDSAIYYAIPAWVAPLFDKVEIGVDEVIPLKLNGFFDWWHLRKKVSEIAPDLIYEMHLSGRTEKFFSLYQKVYKIPYYFHNHHKKSGGKVFDQGVIKALIQRDLDGAWSYLGEGGEKPSYLNYSPKMKMKSSSKDQVILGIVATRETKKWPLSYYAKLCHKIFLDSPSTKILIPLSKSEEDLKAQQELEKLGIPPTVEFLRSPLSDLPENLNGSKLYIGNDTGLKHIAIALGIKTFTFFGPEPPKEWHPYNESEHPYFYIPDLECRTRDAHYCGLHHCESMICLNQILPEQVILALQEDLK
ncbi:MAG: heptosyltransferase-2 [Bacteriovoracaceae bacterium]|jgi:heptosyltransferase-2